MGTWTFWTTYSRSCQDSRFGFQGVGRIGLFGTVTYLRCLELPLSCSSSCVMMLSLILGFLQGRFGKPPTQQDTWRSGPKATYVALQSCTWRGSGIEKEFSTKMHLEGKRKSEEGIFLLRCTWREAEVRRRNFLLRCTWREAEFRKIFRRQFHEHLL